MAFNFNAQNEPMSEINVTPFRRYACAINYIYGNSPFTYSWCTSRFAESAADSLPDDQEPNISINSKGEIYIQEHLVTYQKMVPTFSDCKNRTDTRIYVRGDKNINYGRVLR